MFSFGDFHSESIHYHLVDVFIPFILDFYNTRECLQCHHEVNV